MRSAAILPVVGLALTVGSCGGGAESATGWLAGEGKPVHLALTFDAANGEAKVITPRGGDVRTTGADGTLYQLHVPEGALLSDERISLIPVATVKRLPLEGGSIAAVHLKPEGLRLLKPATLRIRARKEVPVAEQVAFAYFANGRDAHMYPLSRDPSRIELPILHFSGYGFGRAAPNDPGRRALQQATDKEARLSAKVAEVISREREKPEDERSIDIRAEIAASLVQYYKEVLRPLMQIAETDERMAECAAQRYLAWERQMQILGLANDDEPGPGWPDLERLRKEGSASLQKIHANYVRKVTERAVKRCREEHDFGVMTDVLALERLAQLLGSTLGSEFEQAMEAIEKCLSFEVEFHSVMELNTPSGETYYEVRAQAPISVALLGASLGNTPTTAPLNYVAFRASGNPKEDLWGKGTGDKIGNGLLEAFANGTISAAGTRPSTLTVYGVSWDLNPKDTEGTNCAGKDDMQKRNVAENFKVTLSPGTPMELVRFKPKYVGEPFTSEQAGWLDDWQRQHREQQVNIPGPKQQSDDAEPPSIYQFDLKPTSPGVWRIEFKDQEAPMAGWATREESYVVLKHTPK